MNQRLRGEVAQHNNVTRKTEMAATAERQRNKMARENMEINHQKELARTEDTVAKRLRREAERTEQTLTDALEDERAQRKEEQERRIVDARRAAVKEEAMAESVDRAEAALEAEREAREHAAV